MIWRAYWDGAHHAMTTHIYRRFWNDMKRPAPKCWIGKWQRSISSGREDCDSAEICKLSYRLALIRWSIMVFEKEIESTTPGPTEKHRRMSTISNPSESILLDFVDTVNSHLSQIVDTDDFHQVIHSTKHLCDTIYKLLARVSAPNMSDDQMSVKCDLLKQKLDMLLDALKEENATSIVGEELTRTLNDLTSRRHSVIAAALASELSSDTKTTIGKTEKDKYNTKERRNSRYFVRSGDKEAIQSRANSLKRAINNVVEASGIYDHKPRHGSRKHSLVALNIPGNPGDPSSVSTTPPPIVNIISPSSSQTHLATAAAVVSCLSPLPDQRRSSMDEYFFSSVNLPVPKQFADGASRRSSGVPEAIKEEDATSALQELERRPPPPPQHTSNTLQVPAIPLSELEFMERSPSANADNIYTSENMIIIDNDQMVSCEYSHGIDQLSNFHNSRSFRSRARILMIMQPKQATYCRPSAMKSAALHRKYWTSSPNLTRTSMQRKSFR